MSVKFETDTRTRLLVDMVLDLDPLGSTIEVAVDGTWYPATWLGSPVQTTVNGKTKWTQTARTDTYFAGPDIDPLDAVTLSSTPKRHATKTRVTWGQDVLTRDSTPIDVT